jgi:exosortase/archaeosortase family protein
MRRPILLLVAQALAFWPVWVWYVRRVASDGDDQAGLVALVAGVAFVIRGEETPDGRPRTGPEWTVATLLTLAYAVTFPAVPPLIRAILALLAMSAIVLPWRVGRLGFPVLGLFLLSLPVMPSAQFYAGHPMRVVVGELAAAALQLAGFPVRREGTILAMDGRQVDVDGPCSGIAMSWAALVLALTLACLLRLPWRGVAIITSLALASVVAANALRSSALFLQEVQVVPSPPGAHTAVGLCCFGLVAAALLWSSHRLAEGARG